MRAPPRPPHSPFVCRTEIAGRGSASEVPNPCLFIGTGLFKQLSSFTAAFRSPVPTSGASWLRKGHALGFMLHAKRE